MATNDNTQVNSFVKGMNSDLSYSMIQDGQYVRGENVRVTGLNQVGEANLTNGVGEIRPIEGVKITESNIQPTKILATGSIRDIGVIVYQDSVDNIWKVGVFKNGHPDDIQVIFNSEEEPQTDKFSIVLHHEIEDLDKLYIADGINPIKLVLIKQEDGIFEKVSKEDAESYPKIIFAPMIFEGLTDGQLKSGMVQYAYRLYKKYSIATDMSPTTNLIPIVNKDSLEGYKQGRVSNAGVSLSITINKDYSFLDRIQIYRIHYEQNGQLPIISMIYDDYIGKLWGPESNSNPSVPYNIWTYDDHGTSELQTISLEEFNSISGVHIIPKVIETKNDYLFAAQIKDIQSDVFSGITNEQLGVELNEVQTELVGDASYTYKENGEYVPCTRHNTIQRKTQNANWRIHLNGFTGQMFNGQFIPEEDYSIRSNPTYSNPKVSYYLKSLRRGETYRYGIVLYDINGNSSGVIHIGDYTVNNTNTFKEYDSDYELVVFPVGLQFTIKWLPENCVAYEIVRCRRTFADMKNISQGVVSKPIKRYNYIDASTGLDSNYPYTPSGFVTMQNIRYTGVHIDNHRPNGGNHTVQADNFDESNIIQFVSPEVLYTPDQFKSMMKDRDYKLQKINTLYSDSGVYMSGYYLPAINNTAIKFTQYGDAGNYELTISSEGTASWAKTFYRYQGVDNSLPIADIFKWEYVPPTDQFITRDIVEDVGKQSGVIMNFPTIKNIKQKAYSYIKLYNQTFTNEQTVDITASIVANELQWNDVFEHNVTENQVVNKYEDFAQNIGVEEFNNVVIGGYYGTNIQLKNSGYDSDVVYFNTGQNELDWNEDDRIFCGAGGRTAVLQLNQPLAKEPFAQTDIRYMYTYLCNIQKDCIPYGGKPSKTDVYYSHGQYFTSNVKTGVVFDGDTYILPMEYVSMHKIYFSTAYDTVPSHMIAYSIPVETSINMSYADGDEISKEYTSNGNITNVQTEPSNVYGIYSQDEPLYSYNTVYSTDTTARLFAPAEDEEDTNAQKSIDYRVMHSNIKSNGEYIDSWLKYQPANYIDVESKYGQITHLRNFHNKLLFWQEQAMGLLSVNERVQISDDNNLPLILGTGGVLDRYDYLDDTAGMKKEQYCDAMSDTTLYWYDDDNNEMRAYADGNGIVQLNKVYGTQNLMHEYDDDNTPWMFYDKKYNEAVLDLSNNPKWSIAYNEQVKAFTSLYNVGFDGAITFKDGIYLLNTNPVQKVTTKTVTKTVSYDEENQVVENVVEEIPVTTTIKPVDLGLSVKWADRYLYATDDKSYGTYVGWGDITGELKVEGYQNYGPQIATNISGDPKYDIATYVLGDGWRLPTREEYNELVTSQNLAWTYDANDLMYTVTANNGNKMLLPASASRNYQGILPTGWGSDRQSCQFWLGDSKGAQMANSAHIGSLTSKRQWAYEAFSDKSQHKLIRPVFDGEYTQQYTTVVKPVTNTQKVTRTETIEEVVDVVEGANLQLGKWNEGNVTNFDGKIKSKLQYVVNKNPLITKVFDNQEIVSSYLPDIEGPDKAWFSENHTYSWKTDLNAAEDVYYLQMTNREGNYRFAIPRANNAAFGNRIRGKYMICSIEDTAPEVDASISYIITKFRTSWS